MSGCCLARLGWPQAHKTRLWYQNTVKPHSDPHTATNLAPTSHKAQVRACAARNATLAKNPASRTCTFFSSSTKTANQVGSRSCTQLKLKQLAPRVLIWPAPPMRRDAAGHVCRCPEGLNGFVCKGCSDGQHKNGVTSCSPKKKPGTCADNAKPFVPRGSVNEENFGKSPFVHVFLEL